MLDWFFALGKRIFLVGLAGLGLTACENIEGTVALGVVGATLVGAQSPSHEIQQIYYLGVFDPQDQLPPQVYRVRVHGQASFVSLVNFASGWVPANLIDSLGTTVSLNKQTGGVKFQKAGEDETAPLKTGRRLVVFGPEGFREAPADHRLVVVMGSSPRISSKLLIRRSARSPRCWRSSARRGLTASCSRL